MFTAQQYRAKALEYEALLTTSSSPAQTSEYRNLRQSYASLADNLEWLAENAGKTIIGDPLDLPSVERRRRRPPESLDEGNILRCLGAAVVLNWNTIPMKLQHALFEAASSIEGVKSGPLRDLLARFLHDHKDDAQHQEQRNS